MSKTPESSTSGLDFRLHPLVLINISDHYTRVKSNARDAQGDVMGFLLGLQTGRVVDISNSFEVLTHDRNIDWEFANERLSQYNEVFPELDLIGWYAVSEKELDEQHMALQRRMMESTESPVFLMMHPTIEPLRKDLPVFLYETEVHVTDNAPSFIFVQSAFSIATEDAERIGVNQVAKTAVGSGEKGSGQFVSHLSGMYASAKMLKDRLAALSQIMEKMELGEVEMDRGILREIAGVVRRVPLFGDDAFQQSFTSEYNDTLLTTHLATITKGIQSANEILEKSQYLLDRPRKKFAS